MPVVRLGNTEIEYTVVHSKRARNIRLQIDIDDGVTLHVPPGCRESHARKILFEKERWLLKKVDEFRSLRAEREMRLKRARREFLYLGKIYPIEIERTATKALHGGLRNGRFVVEAPKDVSLRVVQAHYPALFEKWYRQQARLLIPRRVQILAKQFGFRYRKVFIKNQKTRWGSCSRAGNLNFSCRLLMAPPRIVDAVIIHELAHLRYMNHSEKFWNLVASMNPAYEEHEAWLKQHEHLLIL